MFLIFGTRGSQRPAIETDLACPGCEQEGMMILPFQRYFHIMWIPFFPLNREFIPVCPHCGGQFSPDNLSVTPELRALAPVPKWTFIGLGLLSLPFILMFVLMMIGIIGRALGN